jgi:hypothetical protein
MWIWCLSYDWIFKLQYQDYKTITLHYIYFEFQVPTKVVMKSSVFWDIAPCSPVKIKWRFGVIYRLHLHDRKLRYAELSAFYLIRGDFLLSLLINSEVEGDIFLRNLLWISPSYTKLRARRQNSSITYLFLVYLMMLSLILNTYDCLISE